MEMRGRVMTVIPMQKLRDSAMRSFLRTWTLDGWEFCIIVRGSDIVSLLLLENTIGERGNKENRV